MPSIVESPPRGPVDIGILTVIPPELAAAPVMRQLAREGYVELQGEQPTLAVPLFGAWICFTQGPVSP